MNGKSDIQKRWPAYFFALCMVMVISGVIFLFLALTVFSLNYVAGHLGYEFYIFVNEKLLFGVAFLLGVTLFSYIMTGFKPLRHPSREIRPPSAKSSRLESIAKDREQ